MKVFFFILFTGISSFFYAQDVLRDTLAISAPNLFIQDHKNQFNVKFEVSNDVLTYNLPQEDIKLRIKPNLNIKYGFVLSYKFASIRLGIRPKVSDADELNKGDSKTFRIHFKLLFDYWSHHFAYNYAKGYYIVNTEDFTPPITKSNFHIQFPNLTSNTFTGSSMYKFNENYSVRAIESQTEIQIKSAGSFMPGVVYSYYNIKGAGEILYPEDNLVTRPNYSDIKGFDISLAAGYYYTFVFKKHWYANAFATPSIGLDFHNTTEHTPDAITSDNNIDIFYTLRSGIGIGYNGEKIFLGANFSHGNSSEKFSDNEIKLKTIANTFHVFIGYRFKAPKAVRKSVDLIEEKIPILNDDNN